MSRARVIFAFTLAGAMALSAMLSGCGKNTPEAQTPGAPPPAPTAVAAEKNSFAEVTSHLDPGGNLYFYCGTAQWLEGLSAKVGSFREAVDSLPNLKDTDRENVLHAFDLATNLIKESGIEDVSGFGMSSIEFEKGLYRTKMVLHHYPGQGNGFLWTLFGASPHPLHALDMLPKTTVFAGFGDLDASGLWETLDNDLSQSGIPGVGEGLAKARDAFEQKTGLKLDDMIASLGGEFGVIVTLNGDKKVTIPTGLNQSLDFPEPGILLAVKVKDDLIFDRLEQALKDSRMPFTQTDKDGLKMRTVTVPIPLPITLKPSVARAGDYLFVASSDALIQEVLDVQSGREAGLKSTDEFKHLAQGLPTEGNRFSYVSKRFGETWLDVQGQIADRAADSNPGPAQLIRKLSALSPPANGLFIAANTTEGWMVTGNGNQDTAKMVLLPTVAVPAIAAGVALPAFAKARARAQSVACANNRRQIQVAKQQWARDNSKTGQDVPTWADLKPYLRGGRIPQCPTGGEYEINAVSDQPTCSIHSHSDQE
jgi:hypothetical protein